MSPYNIAAFNQQNRNIYVGLCILSHGYLLINCQGFNFKHKNSKGPSPLTLEFKQLQHTPLTCFIQLQLNNTRPV